MQFDIDKMAAMGRYEIDTRSVVRALVSSATVRLRFP
jgi:hypothetical protein